MLSNARPEEKHINVQSRLSKFCQLNEGRIIYTYYKHKKCSLYLRVHRQ